MNCAHTSDIARSKNNNYALVPVPQKQIGNERQRRFDAEKRFTKHRKTTINNKWMRQKIPKNKITRAPQHDHHAKSTPPPFRAKRKLLHVQPQRSARLSPRKLDATSVLCQYAPGEPLITDECSKRPKLVFSSIHCKKHTNYGRAGKGLGFWKLGGRYCDWR